MHPLTEAINRAVGQFSDKHQPLRMLMVNTLVAIIETEVGPLFAEWKQLHANQGATIENQRRQIEKAEKERDKLQAFKTYVHKRLDDAGVPTDPPSPHRDQGCRIGGRLDFLLREYSMAVSDIETERFRQRTKLGWTPEHDDGHTDGFLAILAAVKALCATRDGHHQIRESLASYFASFDMDPARIYNGTFRQLLVESGALIAAEIERLDRHTEREFDALPATDRLVPLVCGGTTTLPVESKREAITCHGCERTKGWLGTQPPGAKATCPLCKSEFQNASNPEPHCHECGAIVGLPHQDGCKQAKPMPSPAVH